MTSSTGCEKRLYMAVELSASTWRVAFSNEEKVRQVTVAAGDQAGVLVQVERAKEKLGLGEEVPVVCCYEAGRDGFWVHRFLVGAGIRNYVVDAASIEVTRRGRRVKTDRLDAASLVRMLIRYEKGERTVWRVVRVPSEAEEDERRLHRELDRLKKERTAHRSRIRGLLALHGVRVVGRLGKERLAEWRTWDGKELPEGLRGELERELERLGLVEEQIKELEKVQAQRLKEPATAADRVAGKLMALRGVGRCSAWILAKEFLGWRGFRNRRQLGALAGLTGTPYASGGMMREQGISKAGNGWVRWVMIELAWGWVKYQPGSALSQWYWARFGRGSKRLRRVGIVAVARKLLVALWKYAEWGEVPEGAVLKVA